MMPFSEDELSYIKALDAQKDVELLQRELPSLRVESLRTLQVATALLKRCAAAGLNLSEIGTIVSRPLVGLDEDPSDLENMCTAVRKMVDEAAIADEAFDEEQEEEEDSDEEMFVSMQAASLAGARGLSSSRLSGAVSLESAPMHQNSYQDSASMESSPNRSVSDIIHRDEMLFDLDEEHSASGSPRHTAGLTPAASVPASYSSGLRHSALQPGLQASGSYESEHSSPLPLMGGSSKRKGVQWSAGVHGSYCESEAVSTPMGPGAQMMAASLDPSRCVMTGFTKPGKRQSGRKPPRPHRLKKSGRVCIPVPLFAVVPLLVRLSRLGGIHVNSMYPAAMSCNVPSRDVRHRVLHLCGIIFNDAQFDPDIHIMCCVLISR